jgi:hypothetical protein
VPFDGARVKEGARRMRARVGWRAGGGVAVAARVVWLAAVMMNLMAAALGVGVPAFDDD